MTDSYIAGRVGIICVLTGSAVTMLGGCAPVPILHSQVEGDGVRSRILDAATSRPVPSAIVSDPNRGGRTTTAADGSFYLPPHMQWHGGYLLGLGIAYDIWPFTGDAVLPDRLVRVDATGYCREEFAVGVQLRSVEPMASDGHVMVAPDILLRRSVPAGTTPLAAARAERPATRAAR